MLGRPIFLNAIVAGALLVAAGCRRESVEVEAKVDPSALSDADWRSRLTEEQYRILREGGTEDSFGPAYAAFKNDGAGIYHCVGCDAPLFGSTERFDSESGWPAFFDSMAGSAAELRNTSGYMMPQEVVCSRCGGHLGHVFLAEGYPTPTDKRFCINAATLRFVGGESGK